MGPGASGPPVECSTGEFDLFPPTPFWLVFSQKELALFWETMAVKKSSFPRKRNSDVLSVDYSGSIILTEKGQTDDICPVHGLS